MNNALLFLGIAVAVAVLGGLAVLLLHRSPDAPPGSGDAVDEFRRFMDALAPDDEHGADRTG